MNYILSNQAEAIRLEQQSSLASYSLDRELQGLSLLEGGRIVVIDFDGIFLNLGTTNNNLITLMKYANSQFQGNLHNARFIPSLLKECGLSRVSWRIETLDFQGEQRALEVNQWKKRFENSFHFYLEIFRDNFTAKKFIKLYLEEAGREDVPMFYNKFFIIGEK